MRRIAGPTAVLSLCLTLAGAGASLAQSAFDRVFRGGTLDALPPGTELHYDGQGAAEGAWRRVVVGLGPDERAGVQGQGPGAEDPLRPIGDFDATIGNPVAMVFLEHIVRSVAEATGGSPFYIRNRIRDALAGPGEVEAVTVAWDGGMVPATAVTLAPFARDAHRARLGPFADLEISVVVSEGVPGWYHAISARAPASAPASAPAAGGEAFASSLTLAGVQP